MIKNNCLKKSKLFKIIFNYLKKVKLITILKFKMKQINVSKF
jgi:hypothetical protein